MASKVTADVVAVARRLEIIYQRGLAEKTEHPHLTQIARRIGADFEYKNGIAGMDVLSDYFTLMDTHSLRRRIWFAAAVYDRRLEHPFNAT